MEPPKQSAAAGTPETVAVQGSGRGENGRRGQPAGKPPAAMTERRRRRSPTRGRLCRPDRLGFSPFPGPVEASVSMEGMVLQSIVGEVWADFVNEAMEGMMVARREKAAAKVELVATVASFLSFS